MQRTRTIAGTTVLGLILAFGLAAMPASALETADTESTTDLEGHSFTGMVAPDGTVVPEGMSIAEFEALRGIAPTPVVDTVPIENAVPAAALAALRG